MTSPSQPSQSPLFFQLSKKEAPTGPVRAVRGLTMPPLCNQGPLARLCQPGPALTVPGRALATRELMGPQAGAVVTPIEMNQHQSQSSKINHHQSIPATIAVIHENLSRFTMYVEIQ